MTQQERVTGLMRAGQSMLCAAFERLDNKSRFMSKSWDRPGGGGGTARVLSDGAVFEKAGINFSAVHGEQTPPSLWQSHPETKGQPYFACGVSMVLHPQNPYAPAFHANYRYFESGGAAWFGGGMDMTPSYGFEEDAIHFHCTLLDYCAQHNVDYTQLKTMCDNYFTLKHRNEMRGIGGIFFD
jgi:coproporphyrinogen III oxidase